MSVNFNYLALSK